MSMLPGQLYEPKEGSYNLPIFTHDNAISSFTWQYVIDTFIANYGHNANPRLFRDHIITIICMIRDDVLETYNLCEKEILKEVEKK